MKREGVCGMNGDIRNGKNEDKQAVNLTPDFVAGLTFPRVLFGFWESGESDVIVSFCLLLWLFNIPL